MNHGPGESLAALCADLGVGFRSGTTVAKALQGIQKSDRIKKSLKRTESHKKLRSSKRKFLYHLHRQSNVESDYKKNKLLSGMKLTDDNDHSYSKKTRSERK